MSESHLRAASTEVETLLSWGLDYFGRGQIKEAVACWRRVLALSPGHARATAYLESAGTGVTAGDAVDEARERTVATSTSLPAGLPPRASPRPEAGAMTPARGSDLRAWSLATPARGLELRPGERMSPFSAMFLSPEARRSPPAGPTPLPTPVPPSERGTDARATPTPLPPSAGTGVGAARPLVRTVLVADGNTTTASLTRTLARVALGKDATFVTVTSGHEAIETATLRRPDLCVLEFMLSGKDGIETLLKIRERLGNAVPAVLTLQKIERDFVKHRLPERTAMVVRPFDRGTLEAALRSLFGE